MKIKLDIIETAILHTHLKRVLKLEYGHITTKLQRDKFKSIINKIDNLKPVNHKSFVCTELQDDEDTDTIG